MIYIIYVCWTCNLRDHGQGGAVLLSNLTHSTSRQYQLRGKGSKTVPHVCWQGGGGGERNNGVATLEIVCSMVCVRVAKMLII